MPRKPLRPRERRSLPPPDYKYGSNVVSRFINKIDFRGKKVTAEKIIYGALDIIKERTKEDPLFVALHSVVVDSRGDIYVAEVMGIQQGTPFFATRNTRMIQKFTRKYT